MRTFAVECRLNPGRLELPGGTARRAARPAEADAHAAAAAPDASRRIGRLAVVSLYREVALHPKPGLVTPHSRGSHPDMSMATFLRSLFSLRRYFPAIAAAGRGGPGFAELQALGIHAEREMLAATGGINTHRGAVFNLGLLCAAAGAAEPGADAHGLCRTVAERWGDAILAAAAGAAPSHGSEVARRHGSGGARAEAAGGFPSVLEAGLPAYRRVLAETGDAQRAAVQALFALVERLDDSNLLWRGGPAGLALARSRATGFLRRGGALARDWLARAQAIDAEFVAHRLSPGGSADLLAATLFLHALDAAGEGARAGAQGTTLGSPRDEGSALHSRSVLQARNSAPRDPRSTLAAEGGAAFGRPRGRARGVASA